MSSSGAESMLTCSEVEVPTEERTHAGIVFPGMLKTGYLRSLIGERSSVRQGAEEPEGTHLAAMVTGADTELDGTHLAATEEAKQVIKQHTESLKDLVTHNSRIGWVRLSELEEKADGYDMELKFQREALGKMDATVWDGLKDARDESDSLRVRLEQVESQVTQLPERIKGEICAEAPDATSAADARTQEWFFTLEERVTAVVRQLDEKVLAFSEQLVEAAKKLKAGEDDCNFIRAGGSRLQARTGQLEARLDTEIEQLNDELADWEKARSAMDDRRAPRPKSHVGR